MLSPDISVTPVLASAGPRSNGDSISPYHRTGRHTRGKDLPASGSIAGSY